MKNTERLMRGRMKLFKASLYASLYCKNITCQNKQGLSNLARDQQRKSKALLSCYSWEQIVRIFRAFPQPCTVRVCVIPLPNSLFNFVFCFRWMNFNLLSGFWIRETRTDCLNIQSLSFSVLTSKNQREVSLHSQNETMVRLKVR